MVCVGARGQRARAFRAHGGYPAAVHRGLKRILVFVACVLVAWYAHRPLLGAGFLGSDAAVLDRIDESFGAGGLDAPWSVAEVEHRPVAAASLALSRSLHTRDGYYTPGDAGRLRIESLILLVIACFGVRAAVIRGLKPWTGEDHARAAGAAAGAFLMLHPLLVPVVAHLPARGDVVALAASAWSVALLLRGRQDRRALAFASSFLLALVAAASSPAAFLLVPLGFGLEFLASRRHKPLRTRLRTAIQVALGYATALALEWAVRMAMRPGTGTGAGEAPGSVDPQAVLAATDGGVLRAIAVAAEKVGVVVLPVNTSGLVTLWYVAAVLVVLLALHPGFVAARAAPRLWGRVLGGWAIALGVLLVLGVGQRAAPAALADAPDTLALALTMAVGLAISATALSGARRTVIPALVGGSYALLTAGSGATIQWAAADVGHVHSGVLQAAREDSWQRPATWVLDPPRVIWGVEALAPDQDMSLVSSPFLPKDAVPMALRGVERTAFWALTGEPEFRRAREEGLALLVHRPLERGRPAADMDPVYRLARRPFDARGQEPDFSWSGSASSPDGLVLDPLISTHVVAEVGAVAPEAGAPDGPPIIRWSGERTSGAERTGTWVRIDGGLRAVFALETDGRWLLAGSVDDFEVEISVGEVERIRVLAAPPALPEAVVPRAVGEAWTFDIAGLEPRIAVQQSAIESWLLWLIDPATGRHARIAPTGADTGRLTAEGAAKLEGAGLIWILDRAVDGVVVQRARGRRQRAAD